MTDPKIESRKIVLVPLCVETVEACEGGEVWARVTPQGAIPDVDWDFADGTTPSFWFRTQHIRDHEKNETVQQAS